VYWLAVELAVAPPEVWPVLVLVGQGGLELRIGVVWNDQAACQIDQAAEGLGQQVLHKLALDCLAASHSPYV